MAFSKQHYRAIAALLADMFRRDNPRFRRDVFMMACREGLDAVSTFPERGTTPPRDQRKGATS